MNHSIAMVNQNHLIAWARTPDLHLMHRDAPLFMPHWQSATHGPGFPPADQALIDGLPAHDGEPVDASFHIASPVPLPRSPASRRVSFIVTEFGLTASSFQDRIGRPEDYTRDQDQVLTPSRWSRDRLIDHGFDPHRVHVVPHGVRSDIYRPMAADERQLRRAALGYDEDHVVFVNVGVATWNKGIDLLITAFAQLHQRHPQVRLILKDQQSLYGISVQTILAQVASAHPGLIGESTLAAMRVVATNLQQGQLSSLYAVADAYVSPYRAEGFNLPVLEAMACGTPVIVTRGGATDDFAPEGLAQGVTARLHEGSDWPQLGHGMYLEPELDALMEAMERQVLHRRRPEPILAIELAERWSWSRVAEDVLRVCFDERRAP